MAPWSKHDCIWSGREYSWHLQDHIWCNLELLLAYSPVCGSLLACACHLACRSEDDLFVPVDKPHAVDGAECWGNRQADNMFSGHIPTMGNLISLASFVADQNDLSGSLPADWLSSHAMNMFTAQNNSKQNACSTVQAHDSMLGWPNANKYMLLHCQLAYLALRLCSSG